MIGFLPSPSVKFHVLKTLSQRDKVLEFSEMAAGLK